MPCRRHPQPDDDCFACRIRSVNFSAHATGNPAVVEADNRETRWSRDMPAYRRLRTNGLQPRGIDGSAHLEKRAGDQMEIEYGSLLTKSQIRQARAGIELAAELREM